MDPLPDAEYVEFNDMLLPKWKENISFIHTVDLSELLQLKSGSKFQTWTLVDFQLQL